MLILQLQIRFRRKMENTLQIGMGVNFSSSGRPISGNITLLKRIELYAIYFPQYFLLASLWAFMLSVDFSLIKNEQSRTS